MKRIKPWPICHSQNLFWLRSWGPFLERPSKLTGPVSYFEMKVSRKLGCVLASKTLNANMADHLVGAWDKFLESEASEASLFCFDNASTEKSCFVEGLVCFNSLCLWVFEFLNATRREWREWNLVVDKTLTPSPSTTLMDYPNGLPKWTTLKWTTPKNTISDYTLTLHDLRGLQPPFWLIILN